MEDMSENYLEAMETAIYALDNMYADKSNPVPKNRITDIICSIANIQTLLGEKTNGYLDTCIEDTVATLQTAKDILGVNMPDKIKMAVLDGLTDIKDRVASICFDHFTYADIDTSSEVVVNIMREVVKSHLEGSMLDD